MNSSMLTELIAQGENTSLEFKSNEVRPEALAREMVAMSNTFGGTILIGVEDDGSITGIQPPHNEEWISNIARNNIVPAISPVIEFIEHHDRNIAVVQIPKGAHKPYQTIDGKYWIRVGSTNRTATKEELSRLFQEAGLAHFDIAPVERTDRTSLDDAKLHQYFETYYQLDYLRLEAVEQQRLLLNADMLIENDGEYQASIGGLLLFGKQPQRYLPQSSIMFAVFRGREITDELADKKEILGTLPELIDNASALIQLFLPKPSVINGMKREERAAIPANVIREVIVNAVCHRDYSMSQQKISVHLFDNRVEVTSPGKLPNTLTVAKMLAGYSAPRNMFLVKYLDNMRYIDGLGRGVPMIKRLMHDRAQFEEVGARFQVTLAYGRAETYRDDA